MKKLRENGYFLESIILLTKNISSMDLVTITQNYSIVKDSNADLTVGN